MANNNMLINSVSRLSTNDTANNDYTTKMFNLKTRNALFAGRYDPNSNNSQVKTTLPISGSI